ncbi:hypothetical protein Ciccas_012356, partial [Cichlidogyrus casuarinus]
GIRTFVSSFKSPKARVTAYKTVILGKLLTHCCSFALATRQDALRVERVQKLLVRSLPDLRGLPYSEALDKAGLRPLWLSILIRGLCLFNSLMNQADHFNPLNLIPRRGLRGGRRAQLPTPTSERAKRSFRFAFGSKWNRLPALLRESFLSAPGGLQTLLGIPARIELELETGFLL